MTPDDINSPNIGRPSVSTLIDQALAYQRSGRFSAAARHYREALSLAPSNAIAHCSLSVVLASLGEFDEAIAHAATAVSLQPDHLYPHMNAAFIEADRDRFPEALAWIERVPRHLMRNAAALTSLAEILVKAGRHREALVACDEAILLDADFADAHLCRAAALGQLGRPEEAQASLERATALDSAIVSPPQ